MAVAAPGSPLTSPPTPCAPHHTTPPLAAGAAAAGGGGCGGSVGVVACVATWSTHWLCWCCPRPCHSHTHTRGGGHVVVVAVCVWCGCHHHCAPFPPTTTTVSAAPPCPLCVHVRGGTRHSGALWWHARWCVCVWLCVRRAHHTHHPRCPPLSPLSPRSPHPTPATHTHTWHASRHTHTWRALCASSHPLTHTGCLTAHTPDTHTRHWVCVRPSTCSHPPPHTHTGRTGVAHAWVVGRVVTTTTPLVPATHTHTQRDWWWAPWWCVVVWVWAVCASHATNHHAIPPTTTTNALVPPHTHTRDLVDAPLPHTHATCTTTLTNACCVVPTPCHSLTHATSHTHTQWCLPSLTTPSTHPTHATHHTGEGPRARTPVGVAFGEPPPPRWSWAFAVLCWWLLVHQPLFTLTHPSTPTPSSPNHHHHHPIHPVCVVWCVKGQHQAPQWW